MYCTNPGYVWGKGFVPCNKCHSCIINKKKEWADRLIIEMSYWSYKYFVSLTYSPENLPPDMSVSKKDMFDWKKRLGYYIGKVPQLYYCAEYGDIGDLPHYHACIYSDTDIFDKILQSWTKGRVNVKNLTPERCKYVAGYVVKKLDSPPRTDGRTPEFYGASRKPALGYRLLYDILDRFASDDVFRKRMLRHVYPPYSVSIGGKNIRLPPYIRNKLRPLWKLFNEELQFQQSKEKASQSVEILKKIKENLQRMRLMPDDPEPFSFVQEDSQELITIQHNSLSWSDCKLASLEIRKSQEARQRKGYNIKHRRL